MEEAMRAAEQAVLREMRMWLPLIEKPMFDVEEVRSNYKVVRDKLERLEFVQAMDVETRRRSLHAPDRKKNTNLKHPGRTKQEQTPAAL